MPSPNGEVTRVVMLSTSSNGHWHVDTGLELPGTGHVALCADQTSKATTPSSMSSTDKPERYILHFLPHSLTSYPIVFPRAPPAPNASSNIRSVSSSQPGRSSTPQPGGLRKSHSTLSLNEERAPKERETGFAKFLASRKAQPKEEVEEVKAGIEEGIEVERDGYGDWTSIVMVSEGDGMGIGNQSVDVSSLCEESEETDYRSFRAMDVDSA